MSLSLMSSLQLVLISLHSLSRMPAYRSILLHAIPQMGFLDSAGLSHPRVSDSPLLIL